VVEAETRAEDAEDKVSLGITRTKMNKLLSHSENIKLKQ